MQEELVFLQGDDKRIDLKELTRLLDKYPHFSAPASSAFLPFRENLLVAFKGKKPAGFAYFRKYNEGYAIKHIFVLPSFQRQGIARAMTYHIYKRAASEGCEKLILDNVTGGGKNVAKSIKCRNPRRVRTGLITEKPTSSASANVFIEVMPHTRRPKLK